MKKVSHARCTPRTDLVYCQLLTPQETISSVGQRNGNNATKGTNTMNETDKTEISSLLNGMVNMAAIASKGNEKYVDQKVSAFAKEAFEDYIENERYLRDIISSNIDLFVNKNNIRIGMFDNAGELCMCIGEGVHISILTINPKYIAEKTIKVDRVIVSWVFYSTSNTDNPNYRVCSARDLLQHYKKENVDFISPRTAKEWGTLYSEATWTREKNKLLVEQFKKMLSNRTKMFKSTADSNAEVSHRLSNVGEYEKVVA